MRIHIGLLSTLLLLGACDDLAPTDSWSQQELTQAAQPMRADGQPLASQDLWASPANPWASFKAGSWVTYTLPGGVLERHLLQKNTQGKLHLVVQTREPGSSGKWEQRPQLRLVFEHEGWPEIDSLRKGAVISRQPQQVSGYQLEVQVVVSANRTLWLSSAIPGGIVQVQETTGPKKQQILRRLASFGIAK